MKTPMTTLRTATRLTLALGLAAAAIGAQAFELRGFRGVSWGEEAERLGAANIVQQEGDVTCYERAHENMLFGDSSLKAVRYCFHQDRLFMVRLDAAVNAKALSTEFQRTYGRPDARRGQDASWGGKASGTRAELVAQGELAQLTLYSNKVEPALAQRMQKGLPADAATQTLGKATTQTVAAAGY